MRTLLLLLAAVALASCIAGRDRWSSAAYLLESVRVECAYPSVTAVRKDEGDLMTFILTCKKEAKR